MKARQLELEADVESLTAAFQCALSLGDMSPAVLAQPTSRVVPEDDLAPELRTDLLMDANPPWSGGGQTSRGGAEPHPFHRSVPTHQEFVHSVRLNASQLPVQAKHEADKLRQFAYANTSRHIVTAVDNANHWVMHGHCHRSGCVDGASTFERNQNEWAQAYASALESECVHNQALNQSGTGLLRKRREKSGVFPIRSVTLSA